MFVVGSEMRTSRKTPRGGSIIARMILKTSLLSKSACITAFDPRRIIALAMPKIDCRQLRKRGLNETLIYLAVNGIFGSGW